MGSVADRASARPVADHTPVLHGASWDCTASAHPGRRLSGRRGQCGLDVPTLGRRHQMDRGQDAGDGVGLSRARSAGDDGHAVREGPPGRQPLQVLSGTGVRRRTVCRVLPRRRLRRAPGRVCCGPSPPRQPVASTDRRLRPRAPVALEVDAGARPTPADGVRRSTGASGRRTIGDRSSLSAHPPGSGHGRAPIGQCSLRPGRPGRRPGPTPRRRVRAGWPGRPGPEPSRSSAGGLRLQTEHGGGQLDLERPEHTGLHERREDRTIPGLPRQTGPAGPERQSRAPGGRTSPSVTAATAPVEEVTQIGHESQGWASRTPRGAVRRWWPHRDRSSPGRRDRPRQRGPRTAGSRGTRHRRYRWSATA